VPLPSAETLGAAAECRVDYDTTVGSGGSFENVQAGMVVALGNSCVTVNCIPPVPIRNLTT
jgi:hypothetical protein